MFAFRYWVIGVLLIVFGDATGQKKAAAQAPPLSRILTLAGEVGCEVFLVDTLTVFEIL